MATNNSELGRRDFHTRFRTATFKVQILARYIYILNKHGLKTQSLSVFQGAPSPSSSAVSPLTAARGAADINIYTKAQLLWSVLTTSARLEPSRPARSIQACNWYIC